MSLKLINILKEEVTEQGYGHYFKDWELSSGKKVGDTRGFDFTTNKPFDKDYKNPESEVLSSSEEEDNDTDEENVGSTSDQFILGKEIKIDKNGPANHKTRALGNWESDNATDIFNSPGSTVYSITKGNVKKIGGNQNDHSGKIYGASVKVSGADGYPDIFYTHMQNIKVSVGQTVTLGTPIGEISKWNDNPSSSHVHVGLPWGEKLSDLLNLDNGKIK
jgi:murein DD-endopeptidase MepM/ murein hydrolase activator NlpD